MKKMLLLFIFLVSVEMLSAQVLIAFLFGDKLNNEKLEFGLDVGINSTYILNLDYEYASYGVNFGLNFLYKINDKIHLNPALYYSFPMGVNGIEVYETPDSNLNDLMKSAKVERELSYFSLPVTVRFRISKLFYIEAGPQLNYLTKAVDVFSVSLFNDDNLTYTANIEDDYNKFDLGATIGVTHRFKRDSGLAISLRYYNSIFDISKNSSTVKLYNSAVYFSVTIPMMGVGAKELE